MAKIYLFGKHFQSGQNINMFSLDAEHDFINLDMFTSESIEDIVFSKEFRKPFTTFVLNNYTEILTEPQQAYLQLNREEQILYFSKQARYKYRKLMSRRLMKAYFDGENLEYYHNINSDVNEILTAKALYDLADDNVKFTQFIIANIDNEYINNLVYVRMSSKVRMQLMYAYHNEEHVPKAKYLNEIYEQVEKDLDSIKKRIDKHKKV